MPWRPLCHFKEIAFRKAKSIKHTVDDIAKRTRYHQAENRENHTVHLLLFQPFDKIPAEQAHQKNTHDGQQQFPNLLPEANSKSHTFILHKMKVQPLPEQRNSLSHSKMCLYPKFDDLIYDDEHKHHNYRNPSVFLFQFFSFNNYYTK